jgi:hypothetical protein
MTPIAELDRALDEVTHERGKTRILYKYIIRAGY